MTALDDYISSIEETVFCYKCYKRDNKKTQSKLLRKLMMDSENKRKAAKQELLDNDAKAPKRAKAKKNEESD